MHSSYQNVSMQAKFYVEIDRFSSKLHIKSSQLSDIHKSKLVSIYIYLSICECTSKVLSPTFDEYQNFGMHEIFMNDFVDHILGVKFLI